MTDSRSERLRRRRKRSKERRNDTTDDPESEQGRRNATSSSSERSKAEADTSAADASERDTTGPDTPEADAAESGSDQEFVSVKDQQVGTYMYLPETQTMELRRLYNILKAEYEFRYDEEFEKNRHFYPLVVQYGLDSLEGLDASEIRERLENIS